MPEGIESWRAWYHPFLKWLKKYPQIKAISYINCDWYFWSNKLRFHGIIGKTLD